MFSSDLDAHGQVILSAQAKRRQVAVALRGQNFAPEMANELATLGGLDGTCGDVLHTRLMGGTILTETVARQTLLNGATGLLYVLGMNLTAQEPFAHLVAKGLAGTTGVFLGAGYSPPITHHVTRTGCEARCELAIVAMTRTLRIPFDRIRKAWAFAQACWSGNLADRLQPQTVSGIALLDEQSVPLKWWQHVAVALLTDGGLVVIDPPIYPTGPVLLGEWHRLINVPNNHPGQTQETLYGQPPILGGQPRGVLGYAAVKEPPTIADCLRDAYGQMQIAAFGYPLPNL